jgi:hypothetical protein
MAYFMFLVIRKQRICLRWFLLSCLHPLLHMVIRINSGAHSSAVEHYIDIVVVTGSIPVVPTIFVLFPPKHPHHFRCNNCRRMHRDKILDVLGQLDLRGLEQFPIHDGALVLR